jgi:hypothetical protein
MLDITRYARRWRVAWWTQRVAFPLALVVAGIILLARGMESFGRLDVVEELLHAQISSESGVSDVQRQGMHEFATAFFKLAHHAAGPGFLWALSITVALLFELIAYLAGCVRFRLWLLSLSLVALAVTAFLAFLGLSYAASVHPGGELFTPQADEVQRHYSETLFVLATLVFFATAILLVVRGITIILIWRHRMRPDLQRTTRMTRSLGVNLALPRIAWRHLSPAGIAVHMTILLVLGSLAYVFRAWLVIAVAYGVIGLFFLLFNTPLQLIQISARLFRGVSPDFAQEWSTFVLAVGHVSKLILVVAVLALASVVWRIGQRLNLRHRNAIILQDKPPVLLLRSFADDADRIPSSRLTQRLFRRRKRLEETIADELAKAAPFVAIGKPGERLPQIGASRIYVSDSDWQQVVTSYIERANLIIVIAGKTHWVQWELANVLTRGLISRLLIIFPRIDEAERLARWNNLRTAFDGTDFAAAAARLDIAHALAIFVGDGREFVTVKNRKATQSDYETALRVATFLMMTRSGL